MQGSPLRAEEQAKNRKHTPQSLGCQSVKFHDNVIIDGTSHRLLTRRMQFCATGAGDFGRGSVPAHCRKLTPAERALIVAVKAGEKGTWNTGGFSLFLVPALLAHSLLLLASPIVAMSAPPLVSVDFLLDKKEMDRTPFAEGARGVHRRLVAVRFEHTAYRISFWADLFEAPIADQPRVPIAEETDYKTLFKWGGLVLFLLLLFRVMFVTGKA